MIHSNIAHFSMNLSIIGLHCNPLCTQSNYGSHQCGIGRAANCKFGAELTLGRIKIQHYLQLYLRSQCSYSIVKKTSTTNKGNSPSNPNFNMHDSCKIDSEVQYRLDSSKEKILKRSKVLSSVRYEGLLCQLRDLLPQQISALKGLPPADRMHHLCLDPFAAELSCECCTCF